MHTSESVTVPASPAEVFPFVANLGAYPSWLPLVHAASPAGVVDADDVTAWLVELRARVGPFARSKQLRMERTGIEVDRSATFERAEIDGRDHAKWALHAELQPAPEGTLVTMHLAYEGRLWTGGILERVLEEEIRRGQAGLIGVVAR